MARDYDSLRECIQRSPQLAKAVEIYFLTNSLKSFGFPTRFRHRSQLQPGIAGWRDPRQCVNVL